MKILELRFKNLNSLCGEWVIDFTDPEYVSDGIFTLSGPTGSGKSTILDAICLALYGATPRLGRVTRSENEIMSRQTGECYAEVLFESQAGRFRCHWEQRRARKKADGKLQEQEHSIADDLSGKPIETKKSAVGVVIEEKTGMDFDRFTRSVLLAQGAFDNFLKADVEQKSKVLEQITGTGIYSEISKRVHLRQRDERDKLNLLRAETAGIAILEPEQEEEIRQDLEKKRVQETELAENVKETEKSIVWLSTIDTLKKEIQSLAEQKVKLQTEIDSFKPQREKLQQAKKAASLDGIYATISSLRKQQSDDGAALENEREAIPELEGSAKTFHSSFETAQQSTLKTKSDLKAAAPLIQKIRSLDLKIAEQQNIVAEGLESCTKDEKKIGADKLAKDKHLQKRKTAEKEIAVAEQYLTDNAQDEWLISGLAGIEEQIGNLLSRKNEITQKETALKSATSAFVKAKEKLDVAIKKKETFKGKLREAEEKLQKGKDALSELLGDKLLREYRTELETLFREMAYVKKIAELKDYRAQLEDGKPCLLCGSKEHPFAEGNVPVPNATEQKIKSLEDLIGKAEGQEEIIRKIEKENQAIHKELNESDKQEANASGDKKGAEKTCADWTEDLKKLRSGFEELKRSVSQKLQPLGITEIPEDQIATLPGSLNARLKVWQEKVGKKGEVEKQIAAIDREISRLEAVIETQSMALTEKREKVQQLERELAATREERKEIYGDKDPGQEEEKLNRAVVDAEETEKEAASQNALMQQNLTAAKTKVGSLEERIARRQPELETQQTDFSSALVNAGFEDEQKFLRTRLTTEERDALSGREKELDNKETELKVRQTDQQTRLAAETAKEITDKTLEELEPQLKESEESLKELRDTVAGLGHVLKEDAAAKERIKEKQSAIAAQQKECNRWDKLHSYIGSADGKKYRNFAQGLTFELMVSHANRQLKEMTDRYLLMHDQQHPLELYVVDNYQAGEIRSTKNLSGGESFIVSLALALGLSKMASQKVRVDSLFLDEGFGTLDEEALETALEALARLQQDGKLIGIISHISALKERIRTQINVSPLSGGKSEISGPGVKATI